MRTLRTFIRLRRFARNDRGGTLAELAILLPVLILMLATVSELGRLFQTFNTLSKSTRAAARYLTTVTYTPNNVDAARNVAFCGKTNCDKASPVVSGLTLDDVKVAAECKDGGKICAGNPIRVMVYIDGYTFSPVFNLATMFGVERFAAFPVRPATTMYYYQVDAAEGTE